MWMSFVLLCFSALLGVQSPKSTELVQSVTRAALQLAGQGLDSLLVKLITWVSAHEQALVLITLAGVALVWVVVAVRLTTVTRRARQPHPRLGDWWVVNHSRRPAPRLETQPSVRARTAAFMDATAAAAHAGVSRGALFRWARGGRLTGRREGAGLRFSSDDLAALRPRLGGSGAVKPRREAR
jgi:hypothetical protein